ncbi:L-2-hydroxyglutarate oxidase LhgO [Colwellia chukchiensis]|uniref:L-2-hydroxyglutarate oxidase LhgO n=1 Tax=Colwellia chukchiensis TaxID=641665 RepID=A0A1H7R9L5_9GAMM|nr:NAD(P)/FAD-dependent oxidoreductase [Colwellia chukchiensis]SEL56665.1 L-2-hydroxyglutarate oxidase LhgO [Colwellia chukchiensis]
MDSVDVLVVGAGVVGLAIAAKLSKHYPQLLIVEKNLSFGEETSSRNSEVIHAGLYYPEHSLKARLCVEGKQLLYQYCQQRHIPHKKLGKLLVANGKAEEAALANILNQAQRNGVHDLMWQTRAQLKRSTPELSASIALLSPSTGIIDVHSYMQSLLAEIESNGGTYACQSEVYSVQANRQGFTVQLHSQGEEISIQCAILINCAGLHATRVAKTIEAMPSQYIPTIHYCRGHYFSYHTKSPFQQLIYPIPSANGLGIHASLNTADQLKFGPDTQYINQLDYHVDLELKAKFVAAIRQYFPNLDASKLQPDYAGIRPKLQAENEGFKDFLIQDSNEHGVNGLINLFGIDSPGLTSSLAIARYVEGLV